VTPALVERSSERYPIWKANRIHLFFDMRQGFVTIHRTWPHKGRERLWLGVDASEPVSRVDFPSDGGGKALLTLELSGPPRAAGRLCRVLLNHTEIFSFEVHSRWRRHEVPIPAGILRNGINHLSFHWSTMTGLGDLDSPTSWRRYINQYGYYPVAARIHALRIQQQQPTVQPEINEPARALYQHDGS